MPLFTFYCRVCRKACDLFLRLSEAAEERSCPLCGTKLEQLEGLSTPEEENALSRCGRSGIS
jgi:putative FmdB family regulatory protein